MATITVDYAEESGSPTAEGWSEEGVFSATRQLRCAWTDRLTLASELRGWSAGVYTGVATYPSVPEARVRDIAISPGTEKVTNDFMADGLPDYEHAVVTVNYATRTSGSDGEATDPSDNTVMEESLEVSAEYMNVPGLRLYWDSGHTDPVGIEEAPAILLRLLTWNVTLYNVSHFTPNLNTFVGCVNHVAVRSISLDETFARGTVLFSGCSKQRQAAVIDSTRRWTYNYSFLIRPHDWNTWIRMPENANADLFQPIYLQNGGRFLPYTYIDFVNTIKVRMG